MPAYLSETEWHRDWKNAFPHVYREQSFMDPILGQLHRADIFTPCGTTIEFQNSPIALHELQSREAFYPKLIWVVNGKKFKGFKILKALPDVDDVRIADYEFSLTQNLTMIRKSEVMNPLVKPKKLTFHHPELKKIPFTSHYYSFCWQNPHRVWYAAKCPIIIDFGGYFIYQLKHRRQLSGDYSYLHMMPKKTFIAQYLGA
ncbi:MAG: competence protein [Pedobacter sp.]|nr:competence protein [Pedobacter sp.]MDQ8051603.1 competence protein [Pedobacter sp.]